MPAEAAARKPERRVQGGVIGGRAILCPYHQWSYDLDGHLIAAPHLGARARLRQERHQSLPGWQSKCWGGFIFVHLTPAEAQPLAAQLGAIAAARIERYPLGRAAHRPHDHLCRRRQLEGDLRKLQ